MSTAINTESAKGYSIIIVVLAVVIIAFIVINKLFGGIGSLFTGIGNASKSATDTLGITQTDAQILTDKKINEQAAKVADIQSAWNPQFYKSVPSSTDMTLITNQSAKDLSKQLWESVSYVLPDTPSKGLAAIKQIPTKAAMSYLVDIFKTEYNRDLFSWLKEWYNLPYQKDYLYQIISYVEALPKFKR